ncbi:hypothetical protein [Hymenobacter negativus]|uniref:Lipoprotein n=1 Tax=Hymenobacter negativus TaxID=2795026 RepID=A0ABS3QIA0_9BACT|nr:hypothetical protein [Hymenobacter negativus]MBO2010954.1 hypothetical protein [Hymenobacter negativus]
MKNQVPYRLLLLGPALLSCGHGPKSKPETPATAQTASKQLPARPAAAPFVGYHRYRGTVGNMPVTVELTIGPEYAGDSVRCIGHYYYDRFGGELALKAGRPWQANKPLALAEMVETSDDSTQPVTAHWQAAQPMGPVLTGTWTSTAGRQLPFALHEDYDGAVRYEMLREDAEGENCPANQEGGQQFGLQATEYYLHLLGPDTLQPGLRRLQCPVPAQRRAQLQEELKGLGCDAERYGTSVYREVTYNANGLLSLVQTDDESLGGAYPLGTNTAYTYDLSTGKRCDVRDWLRPEKAGAVAELFDEALRADSTGQLFAGEKTATDSPKKVKLADLPAFGLNSEGLFETLGNVGAPHVAQRLPITIAYAKLVPYVRPNTPLARLLLARGLRKP